MFDPHSNFGSSTIAIAPVPALAGLSLTVAAGEGARFPAAPFNCTVWPSTSASPTSTNAEIIRVTVKVGDVFTILRAQETTAAIAIGVGYFIANTASVQVFTDIENSIIQAISAAGGAATASLVQFDNSPTVSFGRAGQTITASAAGGGGGMAISAGAQSQSTGTIIFSNSNGISFGLNAGTLTASHNGITSQTVQPVAASAVGGSFAFSTIIFANKNNVSFSTTAGEGIVASASYSQSTQPVAASASNGSFLFSTIGFSNANNVTFGTSAGNIVTASVAATVAQSTQPVAASASNGSFLFSTLGFSNANGVTFGTSAGSIITASVGAGIGPGSISAGTTSAALGQVIFSNSNNVTFGMNGSTVTASASNVQSTQPVAASASNGSFLFSTLGFSNANGVTFGTSAGSIVSASVAQSLVAYATGNTILSSSDSLSMSSLVIQGVGIVSVGISAGSILIQATQSNQAFSDSAGSFTFQTLNFSNANNVTFGTSAGSIVTASVAAQSTQPVAASASNGSFLFSTLAFSNGNGVTFGTSAGSIISASISQSVQSIGLSAGTLSTQVTAIVFSNTNNVTFGLAGSTITASVAATVAQTNQTLSLAATSNTTGNTSGMSVDARSLTLRGDGIVSVGFSTSAGGSSIIFSATQSNQAVSNSAGSFTFQTLNFSNANNVTFGTSAGGIVTASVAATVAQSVQPVAVSNSAGSFLFSTLNFSNANNVTFGTSAGNIVTASVAATVAQTNQTLSFALTSNTTGNTSGMSVDARSLTLRGDGIVSVGISTSAGGSSLIFSATQSNQAASASNGSFAFQTIAFSNANGITFGTSAGSIITGSVGATGISIGAGTITNQLSSVVFSDSNRISFGLNGQTITASFSETNQQMTLFATGNTSGSSTGTTNASSMIFRGSGAVTVAITNGSIVFDAPSAAAGNVTFSAGAASAGLNSLVFSNLNGVSFGLNGSTITASAAGGAESNAINLLGANTAGNTTASGSTIGWSGVNLTFSGTNNSQVVVSAPATSSLTGVAGISISSAGSTISVIGPIDSYWDMPIYASSVNTNSVLGQNSLFFQPFDLGNAISAYRINLFASVGTSSGVASNSTWGAGYTGSAALYAKDTGTRSTQLTSFWSGSFFINVSGSSNSNMTVTHVFGISNSSRVSTLQGSSSTYLASSVGGFRVIPMPISSTLTPGRYWLAFAQSTATSNLTGNSFNLSVLNYTQGMINFRPFGTSSAASNASFWPMIEGLGTYSVTSAAFPGTVPINSDSIRGAISQTRPFFNFSGATTGLTML